ncbi:MAG: hypothetical protein ACXWG1_03365 [Usitatibacter sp.]
MNAAPGLIQDLRHSVLDLHKALLDAQRIRYEREHGRIATSGEFLGLVLEHPAFAWLRTLSALIARIDEWIEEQAEKPAEEPSELVGALRSLIAREGGHATFSAPYWEMVNEVPAVLVEHVKLWRLLESAR